MGTNRPLGGSHRLRGDDHHPSTGAGAPWRAVHQSGALAGGGSFGMRIPGLPRRRAQIQAAVACLLDDTGSRYPVLYSIRFKFRRPDRTLARPGLSCGPARSTSDREGSALMPAPGIGPMRDPPASRLIVPADDFGLAPEINEAVEQAHRSGVLTAASLMVAGPAAADAVRRARAMPQLRVGLHLVLVEGRAVLEPQQVKRL